MRPLNAGFAAHIATGATTLCNCWKLIRQDGEVFGFTDHDVALNFDGTDFTPAAGLETGEVTQKLGPQVDTSEVLGIIDAEAVAEADILLGRYDGATVETWRVNWRDVAERDMLRADTIGEIVREDGVFRVELRSAQHALNVAKGRIYQGLCGTSLGDSPCGIDLDNPAYTTTAAVLAVTGRQSAEMSLLSGFESNWFDFGHALWTSGNREGKSDRILSQTQLSDRTLVTFSEPIEDWLQPGDEVTLVAGCDRRFETCKTKFDNVLNFRGFPHIPGDDFILRYPTAGNDFSGKPLVK